MPQLVLEGCAVEPPTPDPGEEAVLRLPAGAADAALASPALLRTGDLHCALFTVRPRSAARVHTPDCCLGMISRINFGPAVRIFSAPCHCKREALLLLMLFLGRFVSTNSRLMSSCTSADRCGVKSLRMARPWAVWRCGGGVPGAHLNLYMLPLSGLCYQA